MRVLVVEDEPYMADAIRDGLRLEAIAADIAGDGESALALLRINSYDLAVLDRDIPPPSGDEVARRIVASGSGIPILMLTAADRIDDKALRVRARRRRLPHQAVRVPRARHAAAGAGPQARAGPASGRRDRGPPAGPVPPRGLRDGRHVALTRKQFAVLEVLVAAEGGVVSAEELLERAWDEHADPFTNAVRITVSGLRRRLGDPPIIATLAGAGYRIDTAPGGGHEAGDRG
jgi:two-component system response regulator VanR